MAESDGESSRLDRIYQVAKEAKGAGLNKRDRREAVIKTVAADRLDEESLKVQERGIKRHFSIEIGRVPVLVDAIHSQEPRLFEVREVLGERYPDVTAGQWERLYRGFIKSPRGMKKDNKYFRDRPNYEEMQAIAKVFNTFEKPTGYMAREIALEGDTSWMVAKLSRMWGDANRKTFFDKPRGIKIEKELIQTVEQPTTARAALFWAVRRAASETAGITEEGEVKKPFMRLALHGMANRKDDVDLVVGGGSMIPGEEQYLASEVVLDWFAKELVLGINDKVKQGSMPREMKLAIHYIKDKQAKVYSVNSEGEVEVSMMEKEGTSLSGSGLGLDYFRDGNIFEVEDIKGRKRRLSIPGFGKGFQTVQLEVSRRVRDGKQARINLTEVLSEVVSDFPEKFPTLESLRE